MVWRMLHEINQENICHKLYSVHNYSCFMRLCWKMIIINLFSYTQTDNYYSSIYKNKNYKNHFLCMNKVRYYYLSTFFYIFINYVVTFFMIFYPKFTKSVSLYERSNESWWSGNGMAGLKVWIMYSRLQLKLNTWRTSKRSPSVKIDTWSTSHDYPSSVYKQLHYIWLYSTLLLYSATGINYVNFENLQGRGNKMAHSHAELTIPLWTAYLFGN